MKDFDYYSDIQTPYPNKNAFTRIYVYDKGEVIYDGFLTEFIQNNIQATLPESAVPQKVVNTAPYKEAHAAYRNEQNILHEEFKNDLFREFGVESHPKRFKCFELAWDQGHSEGHYAVYQQFEELVELLL